MRNSLLIVLGIIFITTCIICATLINIKTEKTEVKKENMQYEQYLNKEILGTDIATLISKAVDKNETNNIQKDEKGYYIDNGRNSIKIDLKMITLEKIYPMEEIYNNEITLFVRNFNFISFKCINIEYHEKTGRISKLVFEELSN